MLGLLSGLDRKNCWTIAEHCGDATPDGLQHLLSRAVWEADGVRDELRSYVVEAFGDPAGILVVDLCRPWNYADDRALGLGELMVRWASGGWVG